jgi:molecular chaperone DnaK (HSP70)
MDIGIPNIWQRVGVRGWQANATVDGLVGGLRDVPVTLLLSWVKARGYDYLRLRAVHKPADSDGDSQEFSDDAAEAEAWVKARGVAADAIPAAIRRGQSHVLVADVGPNAIVTLEIEIDTDAVEFLDASDDAFDSSRPLVREIEVYAVPNRPAPTTHGVIYLTLEPARPMSRYKGYAALDLGNTNSTLVGLPAGGQTGARDVEVVKVERTADSGPVASAVRILRFAPNEDPARMDEAIWQIGSAALEEGQGGDLILGAKRLLADSDPNARLVFSVNGQRHAVAKEFAAELFVCRLFRAFHERKYQVPRSVAITHPTTFSRREVEQLRQAFLRGWRRSVAAELPERANEAFLKNAQSPLPEMILDEASAAAFYFLYRDFADGPGGPGVLKYLYPDGLNLLVFDCGGGTTDIALIQARVSGPSNLRRDSGGRTAWIEIEVLGRTGHRGFGGDDMTTAAFRILKARLAEKVAGPGRVRFPDDLATLGRFLDANARAIDEAIPTTFDPDNVALDDQRIRRDTTNLLWQWAEQLKIEVGRDSDPSARVKTRHAAFQAAQVHLTNRLGTEKTRSGSIFSAVDMSRQEIDALIRRDLKECLNYANKMIEAKLGLNSTRGPGEVHSVYLVGNASKYPLIQEMILEELRVPFVAQKMGKVEGDDLKDSVAKGAALALQSQKRHDALDIRFDTELADKLPFEITFTDRAAGKVRPLYHEHDSYSELGEQRIPVPEPSRDASDPHFAVVYLGRRWPGDRDPVDYLEFPFSRAIVGPLTVWYDPQSFRFLMRDEGGDGEEVAGVEVQKASFRAPVQSGKL